MNALARVILTGENRLPPALRQSENQIRGWSRQVSSHVKNALSGLAGIGGFGLAFGLAKGTSDLFKFQDRLDALGTAAGKDAAAMDRLRQKLEAVAVATGVDAESKLLTGMEKFQEVTGDFDTNVAALETFARVTRATGANLDEVAASAAAVNQNLGVSAAEFERTFDILVAQGDKGKVELRNLAAELPALTANFAAFEKQGVPAVAELGAALQVAARAFGTPAEAATGLLSLIGSIRKNSEGIAKQGVKVFEVGPDGVKRMRAFSDIVFEIASKAEKDPELLKKFLGSDKESTTAMMTLMRNRSMFEDLLDEGAGGGVVDAKFERRIQTPQAKLEQAQAKLKQTFNEALVKHLDKIVTAIELIGKALEFVIEHAAELAVLFGAWKVGGAVGGFAQTLGAGGGLGAGQYGPLTREQDRAQRRQAALQTGASMLQRAGIGYALGQIHSEGLDGELKASMVAGTTALGSLSALPGPVGALALAAGIGAEVIIQAAEKANRGFETAFDPKKNKAGQIIGFDKFALTRSKEFGNAHAMIERGRGTEELEAQRRSAAAWFIRRGREGGGITVGDDGKVGVDAGRLHGLMNQYEIGKEEREILTAQIQEAVKLANEDSVLRGQIGLQGKASVQVTVSLAAGLAGTVENDPAQRRH